MINNEGLLPQITNTFRHQLTRNLELLLPSERNDGVTPPTPKGSDLHLPMTISLIPWISTAGFQDPNRNITTNLSINIIAGYHTKLDGLELGGVLNIKGVEARGAQLAGVGNIVGGDVDGFQISGGLNATGRDVEGFQSRGRGSTSVAGTSTVFKFQADSTLPVEVSKAFKALVGVILRAATSRDCRLAPG